MEPRRLTLPENQASGGTAGKPPAAAAPKSERRALGSLRSNAAKARPTAAEDDAPEYCSAPPTTFAMGSLPRDPFLRLPSRRSRAEAAAFLCGGGELALALARADARAEAAAAAAAARQPCGLQPWALRAGTAAARGLGSAAYSSLGDGALERGSLLALLGGSGGEEGEGGDALLRLCGSGLLEPLGDGATAALLQFTLGSHAAV
jgi:hypothetical protein